MKLDGEFVFDATVQDVWAALFDPQVLAAVLPGCEKLELVDGAYVGDIKVKVGPIQGKFTGKVDLLDKVEPTSYRMVVDGRGAQGFVNATANIELVAEGERTRIRYTSEANIGGKIASVGSRLVETSAKAIVKQSLEGLDENIKLRAAAYREHAAKTAAAASAVEPPVAPPAPEPATETAAAPEPELAAQAPMSDPTPVATDTSTAPAAERDAAPPAPTPVTPTPAAPTPAPSTPAAPVVNYKRADVHKLGAAVAKEVGKSLAPYLVAAAVVIGLVLYLLLR